MIIGTRGNFLPFSQWVFPGFSPSACLVFLLIFWSCYFTSGVIRLRTATLLSLSSKVVTYVLGTNSDLSDSLCDIRPYPRSARHPLFRLFHHKNPSLSPPIRLPKLSPLQSQFRTFGDSVNSWSSIPSLACANRTLCFGLLHQDPRVEVHDSAESFGIPRLGTVFFSRSSVPAVSPEDS
jgi:hypothetical protein